MRVYESQLSTNHLGNFQLTARLWSALKKSGGTRVVNVSSFGHQTPECGAGRRYIGMVCYQPAIKRLQLAHYQMAEKQRKPIDVYFEAGFENLSHFSHAFKNYYGYPPNALFNR